MSKHEKRPPKLVQTSIGPLPKRWCFHLKTSIGPIMVWSDVMVVIDVHAYRFDDLHDVILICTLLFKRCWVGTMIQLVLMIFDCITSIYVCSDSCLNSVSNCSILSYSTFDVYLISLVDVSSMFDHSNEVLVISTRVLQYFSVGFDVLYSITLLCVVILSQCYVDTSILYCVSSSGFIWLCIDDCDTNLIEPE